MIRKLEELDREAVLEYVEQDIACNGFIVGDIENFGFDKEFQDIWAEFSPEEEYWAVLLRYESNYILYAHASFDTEGFARIVKDRGDVKVISGRFPLVEALGANLERGLPRRMYLLALAMEDEVAGPQSELNIQKAVPESCERIWQLRQSITEFRNGGTLESMKRTIETGSGRTFYLANGGGKVISSASSTAESSRSAMVVGVCTAPEYRRLGLATACMQGLCRELTGEGKMPCLFYDNPSAGKIYRGIGFTDAGQWGMLEL